ncbi:D-fructose-6-phosphate amidotransferase [Vibrio sp. JC009]|uniref:D-fructose-6-phosphate amidotransferase n=1 Tax=Vibrio sp. JC009 TaxID=2912314 RepID=UPI0023B09833|nr:D-fructose-6-phosphate amidotransferase [Vibrio sp. JC009]WED24304.1 D-fructose-6-phosphate amidotransferase [Vibrio sp. JC009]
MTKSKLILRDTLGLLLLISTIALVLAVMLDAFALLAYVRHEEVVANTLFSESLPMFVFILPLLFVARYIKRSEWYFAITQNRRFNIIE